MPHRARPGDHRPEGDGQGARRAVCLRRGTGRGPARFLGNEPVLARPLGPAARLARWCRRQPKLATAFGLAAASLVLATGLSIALAWSQYRAATRLRAAQALTLVQQTRAEENFRDAQQAVEDYLVKVSDETLLNQQDSGEFRQLRKSLLENALKYYQRFLARKGDDPKLLVDQAQAYSSIARIIGGIGSTSDAAGVSINKNSQFAKGSSARTRLIPRPATIWRCALPGSPICNSFWAEKASRLHSFERAIAILVPLARANPSDSQTRRSLGTTLINYGLVQDRVNQPALAIRSFRDGLPFLEAQVRDQPGVARWQMDLADGYQGPGHNSGVGGPGWPGAAIPLRRP